MTVDPLQLWKDSLEDQPKVSSGGGDNFAGWYAERITDIEPDPDALVPTDFVFTFAQAALVSALDALSPTTSPSAGIDGFADAWEQALLASAIVVAPLTFIPPSSPATTFSAVASAIIDVSSIEAGKAKLAELVSAPPVANAQDSLFPVKFREATLLLTVTISGTNSVTPTPGPLTASNVPLV